MITKADEGGRVGLKTPKTGKHNMWTAQGSNESRNGCCCEVPSLPVLLDRLQHLLHRPRQLLPHHPPHQKKPLHFLRHSSYTLPYRCRGYLGKKYFILSGTKEMRLARSEFLIKKITTILGINDTLKKENHQHKFLHIGIYAVLSNSYSFSYSLK